MRRFSWPVLADNRGDTIVEVLISIAIISLVLAISYATANHNVRTIQDSQEHSQALQLAQRQLEFLRANDGSANQITPPSDQCFDDSGNPQPGSRPIPNDPCIVDAAGTPIGNTSQQPQYTISVTEDTTTSTYIVAVTWPSLLQGSLTDQLTLYYRP